MLWKEEVDHFWKFLAGNVPKSPHDSGVNGRCLVTLILQCDGQTKAVNLHQPLNVHKGAYVKL